MKISKRFNSILVSIFVICLLMTGCDKNFQSNNSSKNNSSTEQGSSLENSEESSEENSENSSNAETSASLDITFYSKELTDDEKQALKTMKELAKFYLDITPEHADEICDISLTLSSDSSYVKVTKGITTKAQLEERLSEMVSDKLKTEIVDGLFGYSYQEKDGELYFEKHGYAHGGLIGSDRLILNSIEYPDENTAVFTFTSFGDKDRWDTESDIAESFSVKVVKSNSGFVIDEFPASAYAFFTLYDV